MQRRFALRAVQALVLGGGLVAPIASMPLAEASEPARPVVQVLAARPARAQVRPGETVRVSFDLEAPARWHIYPAARKPLLGRQTVFEFDGAEVAGPIVEPRPRYRREGVLESDFHEGRVTIDVPIRLAPGAAPGTRILKGRVVYLICDWNLCLNGQAPFQFGLNVIGGEPVAQPAPR